MLSFDEASVNELVEAHVHLYKTLHPSVKPHFQTLIKNVLRIEGSDFANLADIEAPFGSLKNDEVHLLHWPPKDARNPSCGSIGQNRVSPSIKLCRDIFPNFDKAFLLDLIPKREELYVTDHTGKKGTRRNIVQLYRRRKTFPEYLNFVETLIRNLKSPSGKGNIFVYGRPVRTWWEAVFGKMHAIELNGTSWHIHFIYHPEAINNYISSAERLKTAQKIINIGVQHGVAVNEEYLRAIAPTVRTSAQEMDTSVEEMVDPEHDKAIQNAVEEVNEAKTEEGSTLRAIEEGKWLNSLAGQDTYLQTYFAGFEDYCRTHPVLEQAQAVEKLRTTVKRKQEIYKDPLMCSEEASLACYECNEPLPNWQAMRQHWHHHHIEKIYDESRVHLIGDKEPVFPCFAPGCTFFHRKNEALRRHWSREHGDLGVWNPHRSEKVLVSRFKSTFSAPTLLGTQPLKQAPNFATLQFWTCWVCDRVFMQDGIFNKHFKMKHHSSS